MPFNCCLARQVDRDDDVGDLARLVNSGSCSSWPTGCRLKLRALRAYISWRFGYCPELVEDLDAARRQGGS